MGQFFTHEMKDEVIQELKFRVEALMKKVDQIEKGQQLKDLEEHNSFLESQVEILHRDIANIHFNQTIGWTETN